MMDNINDSKDEKELRDLENEMKRIVDAPTSDILQTVNPNPKLNSSTIVEAPVAKMGVNKVVFGSLTLALLIALLGGAYFLGSIRSKSSVSTSVSPTVEITVTPSGVVLTPTESIDLTSDWKIYTDAKYGFTFKYPVNFGNQGVVAGPYTGSSVFIQSFSDPKTVIESTDAPFDGFSVYVTTDMKSNSFEDYIANELKAMSNSENAFMSGAQKVQLPNGAALLTADRGYYYLPSPDRKNIVVLAFIQQNPAFKIEFDRILSTLKFLN